MQRGPLQLAPGDGIGRPYGNQNGATWVDGDAKSQSPVDAVMAAQLWRVSVVGSATLTARLTYGTSSTLTIANLQLPLVAYVPGQVGITLTPTTSVGAKEALVTLTPVSAPGVQRLRTVHTTGDTLPISAVLFTATAASTITLDGIAIAVPVATTIPVHAGAVLTAGDGIADHEA